MFALSVTIIMLFDRRAKFPVVVASASREEWNPMKMDYETPSFNSYTKGPGKLLKPSPVSGEKNCSLYVCNIPVQLNRVRKDRATAQPLISFFS